MSWNSRKNGKFTNIILVIICIALIVILGGLLVTNHKEVKQESERLQKLSEKQETGIDDYEAVKEHVSELEEEAAEEEDTGAADSSKKDQKKSAVSADKSSDTDKAPAQDKSSESGDAQNTDKSNADSKDSEKK